MARLWKNNSYSTLAVALAPTDTTLIVATGQGDRFPVVSAPDVAYVTLEDAAGNIEIVQVTNRNLGADAMTIVRGQEGTTPRAWATGSIVELRATAAAFTSYEAHKEATSNAHTASAISNVPSGNLSSTNVQSALNELQTDIDAHKAATSNAHAASAISNTPSGNLSSTNVQSALDELQGDIDAHKAAASNAHTASAISNTPSGNLSSTNVQSALNELQGDIDGLQGLRQLTKDNTLINGDFDIWQRGTSFLNWGSYWADRWRGNTFNGTTVSRQQHTPGSAPGQPPYYLRYDRPIAADSENIVLAQRIEDVFTHAGETVTVSIECAAAASKTFAVSFLQRFGVGGSANVETPRQNLNVTTTRQVHTLTFSIPSISGKTIGTHSYLEFRIIEAASFSTFTLDVFRVKVEPGSVATPFVRRPLALELALCQRYYEKSFPLETAPTWNTGVLEGSHYTVQIVAAGTQQPATTPIVFQTRKRVAPVVVFYNPQNTNNLARNTSIAADCIPTITRISDSGVHYTFMTTTGSAIGNGIAVHWTADAEL